MAYKMTDRDALQTAEQAVKKYKANLDQNIQKMIAAGQACGLAMGNDDVCRHYLEEMGKTIIKLQNESNEIDILHKQILKKIEQYDIIVESMNKEP